MNGCSCMFICGLNTVVIEAAACKFSFTSTTSNLHVCYRASASTEHCYISRMNCFWLPRVLQPDFIWPPQIPPPLSTTIPATPAPSHPLILPPRSSVKGPAPSHYKKTSTLQRARKLRWLEKPGVKFTHGDLKHHNILVDEEHVTRFLNREAAAGWLPDFWEYTTAMRYLPAGNWWYEFLLELGAGGYREESEFERGVTNLTVDALW